MPWEDELDTDEGWAKYNRHYWLRDYRGFLDFFFGKLFREPHSTKQIEDCVGWGLETTPETLIAAHDGAKPEPEEARELARRVRCPVLVLHGTQDAIASHTRGRGAGRAHGRPPRPGRGRGARATRARPCLLQSPAPRLRPEARVSILSPAARAVARPLPRRGGLRRAGRRPPLLRGLRRAASRRSCCCRRGHSSTRATGSCKSRAWHGTAVSSRSTGAATAAPTVPGAPTRTRSASSLRTRSRSWTPPRRSAPSSSACRARRCWGVMLAAEHPERIAGAALIGSTVPLAPPLPERTVYPFDERLETDDGWAKCNIHHWLRDYRDFLEFFIGKCFTEPHSTKQIEDAIGWALETTPDVARGPRRRHRPADRRRSFAGALRARSLSGARHPRRRGRAATRTREGWRSPRRRAGSSSRSRAPDTFRRREIR